MQYAINCSPHHFTITLYNVSIHLPLPAGFAELVWCTCERVVAGIRIESANVVLLMLAAEVTNDASSLELLLKNVVTGASGVDTVLLVFSGSAGREYRLLTLDCLADIKLA